MSILQNLVIQHICLNSSSIMFLLLNRVFFDMKDVHMDVSYISAQSK